LRLAVPAGRAVIPLIFGEIPLNWNKWLRQSHRWVSIVFTLAVVANFVAMGLGDPPPWIVYAPLPPLFLLMASGLYLFVLPYAAKRCSGQPIKG